MELNVYVERVVHWMSSELLFDIGVVAILICCDCWEIIINCIVKLLLSGLMLKPALTSFFSAIMSIAIDGMKLNCVEIFSQ